MQLCLRGGERSDAFRRSDTLCNTCCESDTFQEEDQQLRKRRPKGQTELQETSAATSYTLLCFSWKCHEAQSLCRTLTSISFKRWCFHFQDTHFSNPILKTFKSSANCWKLNKIVEKQVLVFKLLTSQVSEHSFRVNLPRNLQKILSCFLEIGNREEPNFEV